MAIVRFSLRVCAAQAMGDQCSLLRGSLGAGGGFKSPVTGALYSTQKQPPHQMQVDSSWTPVWDTRYSGGANQFGRHVRRFYYHLFIPSINLLLGYHGGHCLFLSSSEPFLISSRPVVWPGPVTMISKSLHNRWMYG